VERIICQLLAALEYLHDEKNVCHRDIKMKNILSDKNGNIRLVDFGLSRYFDPTEPNMKTSCGTYRYTSPEILEGKPYSQQCDI
jgi:serine/threonine protein kinase